MLGGLIGVSVIHWLRKIIHDDVLAAILTISSAYVCFYLAEFTFLKVSGMH
jgi:hypothetical protein